MVADTEEVDVDAEKLAALLEDSPEDSETPARLLAELARKELLRSLRSTDVVL